MSALSVLCRASPSPLLLVASAATADAPQTMDPDFASSVAEWTTKPEFLSPLVDHLPTVAGIPSPRDVLGYHIGAPKKLTYYADILRYYRSLEAANSPRVKVLTTGTTDEGRECLVVFVGSEETIGSLERHRGSLRHWPTRAASPRPEVRASHRGRQADLPPHGRPAQRRNRTARDAHGAGVPAGGRGLAA